MVHLVRLDEGDTREGVRLVFESLGVFGGKFSLLELKLQIFRNPPVVVAAVGDGYKFIGALLQEWVPGSVVDQKGNHALAEDVLVTVDKVPDSDR